MADETNQISGGAKQGVPPKVPSRRRLYRIIASRAEEILAALFEALQSKNPSLKLGAAKILINKILPDLKATELTGKGGKSLDGLIHVVYDRGQTSEVADPSNP